MIFIIFTYEIQNNKYLLSIYSFYLITFGITRFCAFTGVFVGVVAGAFRFLLTKFSLGTWGNCSAGSKLVVVGTWGGGGGGATAVRFKNSSSLLLGLFRT